MIRACSNLLHSFGNIIAEIGAVRNYTAGKYLIRRAEDVQPSPGLATGNNYTKSLPEYEGIIDLPTTYGTMLIRLLVLANTTEDLTALHTYQNASHLTEINRTTTASTTITKQVPVQAPYLRDLALNGTLLGIHTPAQQFEFAARLLPYNQPEIYSERYRVATILAQAGVYNGHYHPQAGVNLTEAAVIANASITADVEAPEHIRELGNDWQLSIPSYQGNFGTHYASAAYVALAGYQQQTVVQTLYPGYKSLGFTSMFTLEPNQAQIWTFSGKPKLEKYGFWSLSLYGSDQYLIPNELNRFEVGDRTYNLTYESGSNVYGPQANSSQDGPFQVLIQRASTPPPDNWTSNWLPADDTFSFIRKLELLPWRKLISFADYLIVRWYVPGDAQTNGTYVYPKIENVTAISA